MLFILFLALIYFSGIFSYFSFGNIKHHALMLRSYVDNYYIVSVVTFCTVFIGATIFFIPVTVLLTILSGYLFGIGFGLLYSLFSATLGSLIIFLVTRYVFADVVQNRMGHYIDKFKVQLTNRGYSYLLVLQLLPITPTPLINTMAALLPISAFTFIWTTFVGLFPGSLVYVIAGKELAHISSVNNIVSWPMIITLSLLAFVVFLIPYLLRHKVPLNN